MAENYKIKLGVKLNTSDLKEQIAKIDDRHKIKIGVDLGVDDIRKRISEYNKNVNNAKLHLKIKLDTDDLKKQINQLNLGGTSGGKGISIPVNTKSLEDSLIKVKGIIENIQKSFGVLDDRKGMKDLLSSINQIVTALGKAENESESLVKSLSALSKKDFNVNFGINLGGTGGSVSNNAAYGSYVRNTVIPQLQKQVDSLMKPIKEKFSSYGKMLWGDEDNAWILGELSTKVGYKPNRAFGRIQKDMMDTNNLSKQMSAYREYIDAIQGVAKAHKIDLGSVFATDDFSKSADVLIQDALNIQSGVTKAVENTEDSVEKFKQFFNTGIDTEGLDGVLKPILDDLGEIKRAFESLSSIGTIDGLTESFKELSVVLEKLTSNITIAKQNLDNVGDTTVSDGGVEKAVQDQKELAQSSTQTANVVAQSGQKIQQAYQKISNSASSIGEADVLQLKDDITDADKLSASLSKLKNIQGNINKIKIGEIDASKGVQEIQTLERQLESLSAEHRETVAEINKLGGVSKTQYQSVQNQVNTTNLKLEQLQSKIVDVNTKLANGIRIKIHDQGFDGFEQEIARAKMEADKFKSSSIGLQEALKQVDIAMEAINAADEANDINQLINANKQYEAALKQVYSQIKLNQQAEKNANDKASFKTEQQNALLRLKGLFNENSEAARKFASDVDRLQKELNECGDVSGVRRVNKEITNLSLKIKEAGVQTETFGQKLKAQWEQYKTYLSVASLISYGTQALRSMFEQVKLIDSAMTELKKVTNETDETYNKFLTNAADRAKEIGTTIDGLVSSTADFARLGYGFEDAQGLAEVANIYAVVGDEIEGVEGATKSLISTMAAFKDEMNGMSDSDFAMSIIDVFNEIGNNFSISSGGLGEALERSASSLMAANNTIDESIALITAANTVVQDPTAVGKDYADIKSGYIG